MIQTILIFFLVVTSSEPGQPKLTTQLNVPANMQFIKGGVFMMGQSDGEGDERPVHQVTLSDFYISKFELTVGEYRTFCEETNREMPKEPKWGWVDQHPIVNTTWYDAQDYINWYNEKTGLNFRLPTEAEFEYVLRNGGKPGVYSHEKGRIYENVADETFKVATGRSNIWSGYDDGYAQVAPVGSFPPNELGLYDINGNMWEWVSDWYGAYDDQEVTNPQGPEKGTHKVGRGASFGADPWHCRSAGRNWVKPGFTGPTFRLALSID